MPEQPTILLLPGLLCDASVWTAQMVALEGHARVLVADFSQHDSLVEMARSALALADGPLIVIAHSMGARAALEMVRLAPERIVKLALMDTGVHPRRESEEANRQKLVDLAYREGMAALAREWLPPMLHPDRTDREPLIGPLREMVLRASPKQHERQIRALLNRPDPRPLLPTIRCPTLVLVGRQDRWSPVAQHEEIAAAIPGAELVVIEDSGHMVTVEQPEAVTQALLAWLGFDGSRSAMEKGT
jgi:pimeloyl-ACP methyl ester carboxylesterase